MDATFFEDQAAFRRWLAANHGSAGELLAGFYNAKSSKAGLTYRQALDEALCYGWIDGVRRSRDAESYVQRFSPRTAKSVWSQVNINRAQELLREGRMAAPGLKAFEARDEEATRRYSIENQRALDQEHESQIRANHAAWRFWQQQAPTYRRLNGWWVMSAKQEATRQRRLAVLIEACAEGRRLDPLVSPFKARDAG